ncbi:MAG: sugar isomerase, partial [Bacteroidota bacterium]
MKIRKQQISDHNERALSGHHEAYHHLSTTLDRKAINTTQLVSDLQQLQIAIPSWALGAGGTRFGRFSIGGEPGNLDQKIDDVGILHALTQSAGAISLHIPWDIPSDPRATQQRASELGIVFDA